MVRFGAPELSLSSDFSPRNSRFFLAQTHAMCKENCDKKVRKFPKKSRRLATRPLERVWFDIIGKIPVRGVGGFQYVLVFVDEFTGMYFVDFLKEKSELFDYVINFKLRA